MSMINLTIECLNQIDHVVMKSEINTCLAISKSYDKMLLIEEHYSGDNVDELSIFQEGK